MGKRTSDLSFSQGQPGQQAEVEEERDIVLQRLQSLTDLIRQRFPELLDWWLTIFQRDCMSAVDGELPPQSLASLRHLRLADHKPDQAAEYITLLIDLAAFVKVVLSAGKTVDSEQVAVLAQRDILQLMLLAILAHTATQQRPASQRVSSCKCWYCLC